MMPWWIALQFLTSLPVSLPRMPTPQETGRSFLYYPLVGLVFALVLAALDQVLGDGPLLLRAALLLAAWVALTGGLHLDGLADTADAWVGGYGDRERTLTIMKDPRSGPMAVITLVLLLLVKFAALVALLDAGEQGWLWVPLLGRVALLGLFLTTPYVRPGGLGQALASHLPRRPAGLVLSLCLALGLVLVGQALLAGAVVFVWLRWLLLRRLGGTTGDTAGAMLECIEAAVLAGLAFSL
jgi:adenosylcobinamide-GDP ribazoletransferase